MQKSSSWRMRISLAQFTENQCVVNSTHVKVPEVVGRLSHRGTHHVGGPVLTHCGSLCHRVQWEYCLSLSHLQLMHLFMSSSCTSHPFMFCHSFLSPCSAFFPILITWKFLTIYLNIIGQNIEPANWTSPKLKSGRHTESQSLLKIFL